MKNPTDLFDEKFCFYTFSKTKRGIKRFQNTWFSIPKPSLVKTFISQHYIPNTELEKTWVKKKDINMWCFSGKHPRLSNCKCFEKTYVSKEKVKSVLENIDLILLKNERCPNCKHLQKYHRVYHTGHGWHCQKDNCSLWDVCEKPKALQDISKELL